MPPPPPHAPPPPPPITTPPPTAPPPSAPYPNARTKAPSMVNTWIRSFPSSATTTTLPSVATPVGLRNSAGSQPHRPTDPRHSSCALKMTSRWFLESVTKHSPPAQAIPRGPSSSPCLLPYRVKLSMCAPLTIRNFCIRQCMLSIQKRAPPSCDTSIASWKPRPSAPTSGIVRSSTPLRPPEPGTSSLSAGMSRFVLTSKAPLASLMQRQPSPPSGTRSADALRGSGTHTSAIGCETIATSPTELSQSPPAFSRARLASSSAATSGVNDGSILRPSSYAAIASAYRRSPWSAAPRLA
mmetsp:Transcript_68049/g.151926  ORF Transcript_68049/g.151926 Transcript_68049/m.151926 type:complete len:297 (-) Transcript_68049:331-1221(-)